MFRPRPLLLAVVPFLAPMFATSVGAEPLENASWRVHFQSFWSAGTHPEDFPPGAHFSPWVGASHDGSVTFWTPGELASPGLEALAERGATDILAAEVETAIAGGSAAEVLFGPPLRRSPGSVDLFFETTPDHPRITLVTMLAPSPDWFVGVSGLPLTRDGEWTREISVVLPAWDSGTDSGSTFAAANDDTRPAEAIHEIADGPLGGGPPIGILTITRLDAPDPDPLVLQDGRFEARALYTPPDGTVDAAHPVALTGETGWFWFFSPGNLEIVLKVLDGCAVNDHWWVFASGLTDVGVDLEVTDRDTLRVETWTSPAGTAFQPILDTEAFDCP